MIWEAMLHIQDKVNQYDINKISSLSSLSVFFTFAPTASSWHIPIFPWCRRYRCELSALKCPLSDCQCLLFDKHSSKQTSHKMTDDDRRMVSFSFIRIRNISLIEIIIHHGWSNPPVILLICQKKYCSKSSPMSMSRARKGSTFHPAIDQYFVL